MYYEIKVKADVLEADGTQKEKTESYLVKNVETFAEAEFKGLAIHGATDVIAVKRSRVMEIVTDRLPEIDDKIYSAKVETTTIDDNLKEKKMTYEVLLWAVSVEEAQEVMKSYLKQGMDDMRLVGLKETKMEDII